MRNAASMKESDQLCVRGCITKHKKSQYFQAILIYKDHLGQEKRISRSTKESNKNKAYRVMQDMAAELEEKLRTADPGSYFADYLVHWLDDVIVHQVEPTTYNGYRTNVHNHILPYFAPLRFRLNELQAIHFKGFVTAMLEKPIRGGKTLAYNSVQKLMINIRVALDGAVDEGLIPSNPAQLVKVKKPKDAEEFEAQYLSIEELGQLIRGSKGSLVEAAVLLAALYGFRRGEVCGLKWEHVNFSTHSIQIFETRTKAEKEITKKPKNRASKRTMPMLGIVEEYLLQLKKRQEAENERDPMCWVNSGYLVTAEDGTPLTLHRVNNHYEKVLKQCGLPHIRFHDLRHTVGTYLLELGVPMDQVSYWLGHGSVKTTERIYAHVNKATRMNTSRMLDKLMGYEPKENPMTVDGALRSLFSPLLEP